ncbi:MAG: hypothetical protein AAF242_21410, partial [Bacteroidota bacterium]
MAIVPKLTLAPYLQSWDASNQILKVNLLVMPTGDPRQNLGTSLGVADPGPTFNNSTLVFKAFLSKNWQQMPGFSEVDNEIELAPPMPNNRDPLCDALDLQFTITEPEEVPVRQAEGMIRKHL